MGELTKRGVFIALLEDWESWCQDRCSNPKMDEQLKQDVQDWIDKYDTAGEGTYCLNCGANNHNEEDCPVPWKRRC